MLPSTIFLPVKFLWLMVHHSTRDLLRKLNHGVIVFTITTEHSKNLSPLVTWIPGNICSLGMPHGSHTQTGMGIPSAFNQYLKVDCWGKLPMHIIVHLVMQCTFNNIIMVIFQDIKPQSHLHTSKWRHNGLWKNLEQCVIPVHTEGTNAT